MNDEIHAETVRLISEDSDQLGILPIQEALQIALDRDLDLVEISPNADPPVCRVMDYGKFLYASSKKKQEGKKKQKQIVVKEVKFRPGTDIGDYEIKVRKLGDFLEDGNKAKVTLRFRGREMAHPEIGRRILQRLIDELGELATQETVPRMEGNTMHTILSRRVAGKKS